VEDMPPGQRAAKPKHQAHDAAQGIIFKHEREVPVKKN